jgi:uncharacterized protein (UPF0261 family)
VKPAGDSSLIALTTFKFAEACARHVVDLLSEKGYTVIPFHAQGIGDRAMDELIDQGLFDGVVDLVPAGVSEELLGGNRAAGPDRLEAAGRRGIPQIVTPCGFEMLSCGPLNRKDREDPLWVKLRLAERKLFIPDAFRVQARTDAAELRITAEVVAEKLNRSKGDVKFFIPTAGWSALSKEGADLYEPETDAVFVAGLKKKLPPVIEVRELNTHLGTPEFAEALVETLDEMMNRTQ